MKLVKVTDYNVNVLRNLFQAYEAEFSPITKKEPGANGLYPLDTPLDEHHDAYLFFVEETPIGFAVKGTVQNCNDISEFYVIPTRRGNKFGRRFAHQIFDLYAGDWQVRQIEGSGKARKFWRETISEYTGNSFEEDEVMDPYWGAVTRQRFQ